MEQLKPKILIVINTLEAGGAERVVSLLLQHLQNDIDIHLALFTKKVDYIIPAAIKILDLQQPLHQNKLVRLLVLPWQSYKIYKYCKAQKINTSVAFLYRACIINALLKKLWRYKGRVIMCERIHQSAHIQGKPTWYKWLVKLMIRQVYNSANLVLANSQLIKIDLEQNYKITKPVQVIYNPIDINDVVTKSKEVLPIVFDKNIFYFINVSGFRQQKNHTMLLQAFSRLQNLPCKLLLVGGGVMEQTIKQQVDDLKINDKVIFCGVNTNPFKYINQSNCFVLSSNAEGFPNVVLEALACSKAVIATDCNSGPRELLAPATNLHSPAIGNYQIAAYGILTPVGDAATLANAMRRMYEDVALRHQFEVKAKSRAQQFDVAVIKQYFKQVFIGT
jgi:N-acetylgalactosamine-N,N'-diacetylbacillosaminyl-diphospho-undecaprenol 4-alpha-N-acetylgalactosaminyltransferase